MVRLEGKRCTGVLIASDVVLTAAHCIGLGPIVPRDVQISFPTLRPGMPWICAARGTAFNPLWGDVHVEGRQPAFDVAIVAFDCPLPKGAEPVSVDSDKDRSAMGNEGLPVSVVGYGNLTMDGSAAEDFKAREITDARLKRREVDMRVPSILDAPAMITLQGTSGFTCHGDSGGAVFSDAFGLAHPLLFGINTQTGYGQGCTTTSFIARVDSNYDWIRRAMLSLRSRAPVPERSSDGDACAAVVETAHGELNPPSVEISVTNTCDGAIHCSLLGFTSLSSGKLSPFKDDVFLARGDVHRLEIYTHRPAVHYGTAICDRG